MTTDLIRFRAKLRSCRGSNVGLSLFRYIPVNGVWEKIWGKGTSYWLGRSSTGINENSICLKPFGGRYARYLWLLAFLRFAKQNPSCLGAQPSLAIVIWRALHISWKYICGRLSYSMSSFLIFFCIKTKLLTLFFLLISSNIFSISYHHS